MTLNPNFSIMEKVQFWKILSNFGALGATFSHFYINLWKLYRKIIYILFFNIFLVLMPRRGQIYLLKITRQCRNWRILPKFQALVHSIISWTSNQWMGRFSKYTVLSANNTTHSNKFLKAITFYIWIFLLRTKILTLLFNKDFNRHSWIKICSILNQFM
jgi:hypothetical protein